LAAIGNNKCTFCRKYPCDVQEMKR
jgi:hypothetical protein